ncbi:isoprenylcysteine carboxylmethyltransferase family protein [Promethearchaeum syntrophicum]|uniref:Isoprenylcysteine carboxylmethyltransferase family protein n=1 Tax=Promethearchaeum syntrophicum TaxID=2594042 RepID=A0A5B9DGC6_9ARCH|nr:isoprenylcysteine carboxylmethyltransferase family protein [Candidatus Prometheoarchaeum syntrophicum]QEE18081.1 Isoprenylcysteine carboxyl methyltransferase (ICMT) family protein [Candidatus Prometheoarchaeum syntrophicum]
MTEEIDIKNLVFKAIGQFSFLFLLLGMCFFLPAWTFNYWEAWLYIGTFVSMMIVFLIYMVRNDPGLLKRRLEKKEKRKKQKWVISIANLLFLSIFLIPGFDKRYEWSHVPVWGVILADLIFAFGYLFFFWVMRENSYAAHNVKVEKGVQKVITTGPYAIIRHPMYLAVIIMFGITPLALGSYWGLIPLSVIFVFLYFRIADEEQLLTEELEGYEEYMKQTKYRILPKIW